MKALIITAHPSKNGFSHRIAKQFSGTLNAQNQESEIINIYDEKWKQDFLEFEDIKKIPKCEKQDLIQEKIKNAEYLVFIFPLWWGGVPAILKNFFDINFSSGFAFEFEKSSMKQKKLLKGKKSIVLTTADAPAFIYSFLMYFGDPLKKILKKGILGFCGVELKKYKIFGSMHKKNEEEKKEILEEVTKIALGV